jgi:hypothetical protein
MNIGKESEEPVEYPIPERSQPRREVVPAPEPVQVPVPEKVGANG